MHQKLAVAILVSVLAHIFLIANLSFPLNSSLSEHNIDIDLIKPNMRAKVLQVGFSILDRPKLLRLERELTTVEYTNKIERTNNNTISINKPRTQEVLLKMSLPTLTQDSENSSNQYSINRYLKPSDVDIRAIPLHGISPPTPVSPNKLLVTYQFRVFINKSGIVDQVVNLDSNNTEQLFYSEIEAQVKKMVFIPAKKNGVEVDSYIEIALEV